METQIKNHPKFKELMKNLEDCTKEDNVIMNSEHGVDYCYDITPKDFGLEGCDEDDFDKAIDTLLTDECPYYNSREGYLYTSTCEDIFVNYNATRVYFNSNHTSACKNKLHAYLLIEGFMKTEGYYPSVWEMDSYDNPYQPMEFEKEWREITEEEGEVMLETFSIQEELEDSVVQFYDLPQVILDYIPHNLRSIFLATEGIELQGVDIDLETLTLEMSLHKDEFDQDRGGLLTLDNIEKNPLVRQVGKPNRFGEIYFKFEIQLKSNTTQYLESLIATTVG